jgi:4-methylaminobutanoate oxidase (formaldehyde-forming)
MALPDRSDVVIVGGGVIGCSIAYQLARRGHGDVTVIERRRLTEGSTWHAAGLVGQLRSSPALTELMRLSVATYQTLEAETGYPTGWNPVGSVRVAASDRRWHELTHQVSVANRIGLDAHLISATEAVERFPLLSGAGLRGAAWVPSDGHADPSQLTHAFARGARDLGVRVVEHCRAHAIEQSAGHVTAIHTSQGRIACDVVVNATGMWGRQTARLAAADLAVGAVEHQYVVTGPLDGLPARLPTLRDPDGRFYLKPEGAGLLVGGWEDGTRMPWPAVPPDLGAELFTPDPERFEPLARSASHRIPTFAELGLRTWVNGPIPFTPDAEPLIGLTGPPDNVFHCCGFPAGIAAAGGVGHAMAQWITDGDPGMDLSPFRPQRFGRTGRLAERLVRAYASYYQLAAISHDR